MKVKVLSLAMNDIAEIREYLAEFGEQPPKKFRQGIEKFVNQVSEMPYMFSQYEYNQNYRKAIIIYDYLVFYKVDEESREIKIYRVLHGKRDTKSLLE